MKTRTLQTRKQSRWLTVITALCALPMLTLSHLTVHAQTFTTQTFTAFVDPKPTFSIRGFAGIGNKCLDFGSGPQVNGTPVVITDCSNTSGQAVLIEEVNARHDVILRAGAKVIGVRAQSALTTTTATSTSTSAADTETPLELQDEASRLTIYARNQIFALDGDSILWAADRNRVAKVQNSRGKNGTPIVLGDRDLADSELWSFTASDGSAKRPTTGFVHLSPGSSGAQAVTEFVNAVRSATWGTVIELDQNTALYLTDLPTIFVPAGVTIRGDRRGTNHGPLLSAEFNTVDQPLQSPLCDGGMLYVEGDYVRITGLRMVGPMRVATIDHPYANAIGAPDRFISLIDHDDMSYWSSPVSTGCSDTAPDVRDPSTRPQNIRVMRNYIHHNPHGYGVVTDRAFPLVKGNTFLVNRHAVAATNADLSSYRAFFNLVLSDWVHRNDEEPTADFDVHGTDYNGHCHDCGGPAGEYAEVAKNTILATNRYNFDLRGTPVYQSSFHDNVSMMSDSDAIRNLGDPAKLILSNNKFSSSNPTNRLAVGDFDGDGVQDLFMATGVAWYYAPGGKEAWRLLNTQTEGITNLLFGDFDGDGRTDVLTQHRYNWDVSWGGASSWETINVSPSILGNVAVGNFTGGKRDDIFYADGAHWYVSEGASSQFALVNDSTFRVSSLRFGDFNGDGKTDVFSVVSGYWSVSYSASTAWQPLRRKLTDSVSNLIVADFNGDRRADVAIFSPFTEPFSLTVGLNFQISYGGTGDWTFVRSYPANTLSIAAVGRFDGVSGADLLLWTDNYLQISSRGTGVPTRYSRDDMR